MCHWISVVIYYDLLSYLFQLAIIFTPARSPGLGNQVPANCSLTKSHLGGTSAGTETVGDLRRTSLWQNVTVQGKSGIWDDWLVKGEIMGNPQWFDVFQVLQGWDKPIELETCREIVWIFGARWVEANASSKSDWIRASKVA